MDYVEKWGQDEEDAIALALADLKLTRDEVDVIVLEESSKGFLGFGKKLAKVRVQKKSSPVEKDEIKETESEVEIETENTVLSETAAEESVEEFVEESAEESGKQEAENEEITEKKVTEASSKEKEAFEEVKEERPSDLVAVENSPALDFLKEVTEKMGIDVVVTASENENSIYIDISGADSGTVIGKRGQTLDALQYLTRLVVNKDDETYKRVVVDAGNYRSKREKTLEQLAKRIADKVVKTRRSVKLEPMNPYERKVIHSALQNNPKITTRSEGEEPYRRVIVEMK